MFSFGFDHRPGDAGAAISAFEDEVDPLHTPMGLDVADVHGKSQAAGTYHHGLLDFAVLDVGWHGGSPRVEAKLCPRPGMEVTPALRFTVINSCEQSGNSLIISAGVAKPQQRHFLPSVVSGTEKMS
jgi:hypothetical protein